jgi:integrase
LEALLAALISIYRWHHAESGVMVAGRLLRGTARRRQARGILARLDGRCEPAPIQAILPGCAVFDPQPGVWRGNMRDRFLFAPLADTGMRPGEALGLRISEFVLGRGGNAWVEIVPRADNPNGARVRMMRPRRVYVVRIWNGRSPAI